MCQFEIECYSLNPEIPSSFCAWTSPNERPPIKRPAFSKYLPPSPPHYTTIQSWEKEAQQSNHQHAYTQQHYITKSILQLRVSLPCPWDSSHVHPKHCRKNSKKRRDLCHLSTTKDEYELKNQKRSQVRKPDLL